MSNDNSETASVICSVARVSRCDGGNEWAILAHQPIARRRQPYLCSEPVQLTQFGVTELEAQHALDRLKVGMSIMRICILSPVTSESVSMEEGIVKRAAKSVSQGVGVRATAGEKTGFAYSDELDEAGSGDCGRYGTLHRQFPQGRFPRSRCLSQRRATRDLYPVERAKAEVADGRSGDAVE